jgi:hypothetical protein
MTPVTISAPAQTQSRLSQAVTVDLQNDTDTPEQLHWHGKGARMARQWRE